MEVDVNEGQGKKSPALVIMGAWLVVAIPAAWGLNFTAQNAMKLFVKQPPVGAASKAK